MKRKLWPSEEIVIWIEDYLYRRRDDQRTVTPHEWTRQILRMWVRTVDQYNRRDYDPESFEGKMVELNVVNEEKLLWAYRAQAERKMGKAVTNRPSEARERAVVNG